MTENKQDTSENKQKKSDNQQNKNNNNKKSESEFDIFIAQSIYPEVEPIFTTKYKSIDEIKDDCLVVIDTNALLVPYAVGKDSLAQIRNTYSKLIAENRLIIPGQVAREFAKLRPKKLGEIYHQLHCKSSNIKRPDKKTYPLLESLDDYKKLVEIEEKINQLIKEYQKSIKSIQEYISKLTWNDPVSEIYSDLFKDNVILDLKVNKEEIRTQLERRILHSIPPGYKDSGKDDRGIGDFIIWLTILEAGNEHKKNLIFVSGEEKADWFHRSEGQRLYPRYELVDEYRRKSEGKSFHILYFSEFLEIYGASETTVEEVKQEEEKFNEIKELEEEKNNLEANLIGIFLKKWTGFLTLLFIKSSQNLPPGMINNNSAMQIIRFLSEYQIVSNEFLEKAARVNSIRDKLSHTINDIPSDMITNEIITIDELIDELKTK